MKLFNAQDPADESLHPLWLGIMLLLAVITILSIVCFIRKKCGSQLRRTLQSVCCGTEYKPENRPKVLKQSSLSGPYHWAPVYNPAPNLSPKLYTLVRNLKMNSIEREASIQQDASQDESVEHDIFTIPDESEQMKTSASQKASQANGGPTSNRNSETARKFYASMRQTSQCQTFSSIDSSNNESIIVTQDRPVRSKTRDHLKFFHTPRFFHSIRNSTLR